MWRPACVKQRFCSRGCATKCQKQRSVEAAKERTTKRCSKCRQEKPISEFRRNRSRYDGLQHRCVPCDKEYCADWHQKHAIRRREEARSRNSRKRILVRSFIWNYLLTHPCVDCGETEPVVLDFDHVRGKKQCNIARMFTLSIERVAAEIGKCEVRCANCHRRRTAHVQQWKSRTFATSVAVAQDAERRVVTSEVVESYPPATPIF